MRGAVTSMFLFTSWRLGLLLLVWIITIILVLACCRCIKSLILAIKDQGMNLLMDNPGRLPAYNSTSESELGPVGRRDRRLFPREPLSTLSCDHLENRRGLHYIPPNTPDTFPSTELNPENRLAVQPIPGYLPNLTISNPDEINTPIYEPPPGYTTLEKDLVEENPPSYESLYPSQTEVSSDSLDSSQTGVPSYSLGSYQTGAPTGTLYPSQTVPSESHYSSQPGASPV